MIEGKGLAGVLTWELRERGRATGYKKIKRSRVQGLIYSTLAEGKGKRALLGKKEARRPSNCL